MAHALQLHKEVNNDPIGKHPGVPRSDYIPDGGPLGDNMSFVDREIRRRSMWACFVMDRFTSSGTERPCEIAETELEIQLPSHDRNLELDIPTITERLNGTAHWPGGLEASSTTDNMGVGAYMVRVIALYGRVARYFNQVSTTFLFLRFIHLVPSLESWGNLSRVTQLPVIWGIHLQTSWGETAKGRRCFIGVL